jgi:hypothetical protein
VIKKTTKWKGGKTAGDTKKPGREGVPTVRNLRKKSITY